MQYKEINNLKNSISYAEYYDFFGQIAGLENNKNNLIRHYQNAVKLAPNDYRTKYDYAASLRNHGYFFQAVGLAKELLANYPDDLKALEMLIYCTYGLSRFRETLSLLELNKLEENKIFNFRELVLKATSIKLNDNSR